MGLVNDKLVSFERLVLNRPPKGSNATPVSIKAKDLDANARALTVIPNTDTGQDWYTVNYTDEGTTIVFTTVDFTICENGQPTIYKVAAKRAT